MRSVYKFGGSSIKSATTIKEIAELICHCPNDALVVLSATYNSTNELEEIYHSESHLQEDLIKVFFDKHNSIISELGLNLSLEHIKAELCESLLNDSGADTLDSIYCIGERTSTAILSSYLTKLGKDHHHADARDFITTNTDFNSAKVLFKNTKEKCRQLTKHKLVITQGFIGRTLDGKTSTLGREGSDYSAAIFAWALEDVSELIIWKDVRGIYGHDPKVLSNAPLISALSYRQTNLLTNKGAKILFHRTMNPLIEKGLPLIVKSVFHPEETGTRISAEERGAFKAISTEDSTITVFGQAFEDVKLITHAFELDENNDDYFSLKVNPQEMNEWINLFGDQLFGSHK